MIELKQETWDVFVARFGNRLGAGCSTEHALKMFIEDYWTELDRLAMEAGPKEDNEEVEELDIDEYFERKIKPIWDYVHNLQKQVNLLEQPKVYGPTPKWTPNNVPPVSQPVPVPVGFPYIIPDTHIPPWTVSCSNMNDNVPLSGIATSGYMQVVDEPKYTQEQLEEWSKIRYHWKE